MLSMAYGQASYLSGGEKIPSEHTSMAMAPPCPRSGRVACAQSPTPLRQPSNQASPGFTRLQEA